MRRFFMLSVVSLALIACGSGAAAPIIVVGALVAAGGGGLRINSADGGICARENVNEPGSEEECTPSDELADDAADEPGTDPSPDDELEATK